MNPADVAMGKLVWTELHAKENASGWGPWVMMLAKSALSKGSYQMEMHEDAADGMVLLRFVLRPWSLAGTPRRAEYAHGNKKDAKMTVGARVVGSWYPFLCMARW
jgi:hypothetical protein